MLLKTEEGDPESKMRLVLESSERLLAESHRVMETFLQEHETKLTKKNKTKQNKKTKWL